MFPVWVRKLDWEIVELVPLWEFLMDRSSQKVLLVLIHSDIQIHISSTLTFSFFLHQRFNLDGFIPEADCSFLKILLHDLYIESGFLKNQKWQKCFQSRHISKIHLILLENYNSEVFYHVLNWHLHTTTGLSQGKISGFSPYNGLNSST